MSFFELGVNKDRFCFVCRQAFQPLALQEIMFDRVFAYSLRATVRQEFSLDFICEVDKILLGI